MIEKRDKEGETPANIRAYRKRCCTISKKRRKMETVQWCSCARYMTAAVTGSAPTMCSVHAEHFLHPSSTHRESTVHLNYDENPDRIECSIVCYQSLL